MSSAGDLHNDAMDRAFFANRERLQGNRDAATTLFQQALESELAAINLLKESGGVGRAVLHRSAGWLAMDCERPELAKQLAIKGLAAEPQADIAQELEELLEQAIFSKTLDNSGIVLSQGEVLLSLVGRAVAAGMTLLEDFFPRIHSFQALVYRIVQRNLNLAYTGGVPADIRNSYHMFVSPPRSGSFAVSLKLGTSSLQMPLPGFLGASQVVSEIMDLMELVDKSAVSEIERRIPNPAYRRNFFGLAKKLAPDGDRIARVSFTSVDGGDTRTLSVTTPASRLPVPREPGGYQSGESVEVSGVLRYADASSSQQNRNRIRVVRDGGTQVDIAVPEGLMDDIVRPLWASHVTIRGIRRRRSGVLRLQEIWESEPDSPGRGRTHIRASAGLNSSVQQPLL